MPAARVHVMTSGRGPIRVSVSAAAVERLLSASPYPPELTQDLAIYRPTIEAIGLDKLKADPAETSVVEITEADVTG